MKFEYKIHEEREFNSETVYSVMCRPVKNHLYRIFFGRFEWRYINSKNKYASYFDAYKSTDYKIISEFMEWCKNDDLRNE